MLGVLVGDIPGRHDTALKLLHPLLQQYYSDQGISFCLYSMLDLAIRFCFHLLGEDPDTTGEDQVRSRNLALLIRLLVHHPSWDSRGSFTEAQSDLLMYYHLHICEGTDYNLIKDTFWMLGLGSLNNPERMRHYIDSIIRFMGEETTCVSALRAALAIRLEIASMTQDDESPREDFSKALASAVLLDPKQTTPTDNPLKETSFYNWSRDIPYLRLLCTDPTWHLQLHQNGHFDNCLGKTLQNFPVYQAVQYAASVPHIFAIIDASVDETHPFFDTVQAYPRWPLVLQAWEYIFDTHFFRWRTEGNWISLLREGYLDSLPSLVIYARKESNGNDEPLFALVEEFYRKIEERKQHEQGDAQQGHDWSLWYKEISGLGNQIRIAGCFL